MSFKKIAYNVGELFEMLTFDGNQKLDCENTRKAYKNQNVMKNS